MLRPGRPPDPAKRDAAIAAAQLLFLEHGFDRTSMDAIARAAGVAKPTLYAQFGDKVGLFAASITAKCDAVMGALDVADEHSAEDVLVGVAHRFFALVLDEGALRTHRLVAAERDRHPELGRLFLDRAILYTSARVAEVLRRLSTRGLAIEDPVQAARDLLALLRGWPTLLWELSAPPLSESELDAHARRCVRVILKAHASDAKTPPTEG